MHLDRGKSDAPDYCNQSRVTSCKPVWIDDRPHKLLVMRLDKAVNHLALAIRVEYVNLKTYLFGKGAYGLVVLSKRHTTENVDLCLTSHSHSSAVDHQNLRHLLLPKSD